MRLWVMGISLAFAASTAQAETVTRTIGITIEDTGAFINLTPVDVDEDGFDDLQVGFLDGIPGVFGIASADFSNPITVEPPVAGDIVLTDSGLFPTTVGRIQVPVLSAADLDTPDTTVTPVRYAPGDTVGPRKDITTSGEEALNSGFFPEGGFIGIEITRGTGQWVADAEIIFLTDETADVITNTVTGGLLFEGFHGDTVTTYGFLEVNEGSILIGQAGYNSTLGAGALIPASADGVVPLPAGALLLGSALLGAGALRRRARS